MSASPASSRVTLRTVRQWVAQRQPFPVLTCYDATTARWLWRGGVPSLLVGDTAAQVILGHDTTLPATMPFMLQITAAVRRGAPEAFIMADMPFGSYQCGEDRAMANAMKFMTRGMADVVKLEVDASFVPLVRRMSAAGVPVVAHLGSRPQMKRVQGSSRKHFRSQAQLQETVATARQMAEAGAVMLLLEAVPAEVSQAVLAAVADAGPQGQPLPVVGCGAGPDCHGHVIVLHDLLGLGDWHAPFARPVAALGEQMAQAAAQWVQLVRSGQYLRSDHPYHMES